MMVNSVNIIGSWTPSQIEAVQNIALLAGSAYKASNMTPTNRMDAALAQISCLNHQEVQDSEIAFHLCNIHRSTPVRAEAIERRAHAILKGVA
jgi:hypothetical protein